MSFFHNQAQITAFAEKIDLGLVKMLFEKQYMVQKYRDAMHIEMPKGHLFVFDFGVLVAWGVNPAKQEKYLAELKEIAQEIHSDQVDKYEFIRLEGDSSNLLIADDSLSLPNTNIDTLLALSHAFAQSVKLQHFEAMAEETISSNHYLTKTLAKTGKIPLSRKELAKLRGKLFQTKSDIMLHYNLLDTPEYFWDYPVVEHYYLFLAKYLELTPRTELLNLKLQTIHDLYDMLAAEQNHKHSSFLEWIIIILIAVEIVLFFVH